MERRSDASEVHDDDIEATLAAIPVEHAMQPQDSPADLYHLPPNHVLWGQTIGVQAQVSFSGLPPKNVPQTTILQTEPYREAVDFHIEIAPQSVPTSGQLWVTITESLGQTQVPRSYLVTSTKPRIVHVNSRFVQVTAAWIGAAAAGTIYFAVGCGVGGVRDPALAEAVQQWRLGTAQTAGEAVVPIGQLPGGMSLSAYQMSVLTMSGDAQMYVLFFDASTTLVSGTTAPVWRTPPFTAANQWLAFDDQEDPQVQFSTGIQWACSSTPNVYTTPTGSPVMVVDCKVAQ